MSLFLKRKVSSPQGNKVGCGSGRVLGKVFLERLVHERNQINK